MSRKSFKEVKSKTDEDYSAGNMSREKQEQSEGHDNVGSSAPSNRYQDKQQVVPVSDAMETDAPKSSFTKKKQKTEGGSVKQEVAARVALADSDFAGLPGGSSPSRAGLRTLSYSGDGGTIIGSAANTPVMGASDRRPDAGRFERKLEETNKKINYLASEQVIEEYDNPLPLGQSADKKQGYHGTPKNTSARSQKSTGCHPGDPLYQRSLDLVTRDEVFFLNGQMIQEENVDYQVMPTQSSEWDATDGVRVLHDYDGASAFGNYLPRKLEVTLAKDSRDGAPYVKGFHFVDVIDGSIRTASADIVNKSSTNLEILMNQGEIARQKIDSNAGRETMDEWCDLGRAVPNPTQTNTLLQLVESETGGTIATCYKFANKALAYQLSKAAKDGQHIERPIREMLTGNIADNLTSASYSPTDGKFGFNPLDADHSDAARAAMLSGSAALLIAISDSVQRYSTKADILTQAKSLKQWLQVADNNMNVFRLNPIFGASLNAYDAFSTIDRGYDPLKPIAMTDKVGLIYSIDPEAYCGFDRASVTSDRVYSGIGPFKYAYANRQSNYDLVVEHVLWEGIAKFIEERCNRIFDVLSGHNRSLTEVTWTIPLVHSSCTLSLFDFLVCAALPYMQKIRINAVRDVLDYEVNFEYPYPLLAIKDFNPMNSLNYEITRYSEPLVSKQMIPSVALSWQWPEFFWGIGVNTEGVNEPMYVCPWYFSELEIEPDTDGHSNGSAYGFGSAPDSGVMTFPIIRSGVRFEALDALYSMDERDIRLCLDRMTAIPGSHRVDDKDSYAVYKYSQASDGIPVFMESFTIQDFVATPRELGWHFVAPAGLLRSRDNLKNEYDADNINAYNRFVGGSDSNVAETSYRAYFWYGRTSYDSDILTASSINVSRAQAFKQNWDCSPAARMAKRGTTDSTYETRRDVGFFLSFNESCGTGSSNQVAFLANGGYFKPFTSGLTASGRTYGLQKQLTDAPFNCVGVAKALWGRIQKLFMAISPWDTCDFNEVNGAQFDPYDLMYLFGMAGTMSSDYNEDLYDREQMVQNQGWLYVKDPFVEASPVYRDSIHYTM